MGMGWFRVKRCWIWLTLLLACGVDGPPDPDGLGLEVVHLKVAPDRLGHLNESIHKKIFVPSDMEWKEKSRPIRIRYTGKSSLLHHKRSYLIKVLNGRVWKKKEFRVSSQGTDSSGLRSFLGFSLYRGMGLITPDQQAVSLYLNNKSKGLYHLIDSVDGKFIRNAGDDPASLYKAQFGRLQAATLELETVQKLRIGFDCKIGSGSYRDLQKLIYLIHEVDQNQVSESQSQSQKIENLTKRIDLENYLSYLATTVYLNHFDGFSNNFYLYRSKKDELFRWIPWDLDKVFAAPGEPLPFVKGESIWGRGALARLVRQTPEWRQLYLQKLNLLRTDFSIDKLESLLDEQASKIRTAFARDRVLSSQNNTIEAELNLLKIELRKWLNALYEDMDSLSL